MPYSLEDFFMREPRYPEHVDRVLSDAPPLPDDAAQLIAALLLSGGED